MTDNSGSIPIVRAVLEEHLGPDAVHLADTYPLVRLVNRLEWSTVAAALEAQTGKHVGGLSIAEAGTIAAIARILDA